MSGDETRGSGTRLTAVGRRADGQRADGTFPQRLRGVLVMETEGSCASAWMAALAELGVPLATAREPSVARGSNYAVVVLGTMPGGQCPLAVAKDLRARPADDRPRVVLVSREEVRRVDRVHVDAVVSRPLRIDALVAHVRRLLVLSNRTIPGVRREPSGRLG